MKLLQNKLFRNSYEPRLGEWDAGRRPHPSHPRALAPLLLHRGASSGTPGETAPQPPRRPRLRDRKVPPLPRRHRLAGRKEKSVAVVRRASTARGGRDSEMPAETDHGRRASPPRFPGRERGVSASAWLAAVTRNSAPPHLDLGTGFGSGFGPAAAPHLVLALPKPCTVVRRGP